MWEINSLIQAENFLYSVAVGTLLCLFYDVFRAFRAERVCGAVEIFVQDILYWLISAVFVFSFLLVTTNGELRGYAFFGIAVGFFVCRLTLSVVFFKVLCFLWRHIIHILSVVNSLLARFTAVFNRFYTKCFKKAAFLLKKLLKSTVGLLYTKRDRNILTEQSDNENVQKKE